MIEFDVKKVTLKGSNLVEASAGTGKTFSLAILALRLIIEKDIPVNRILMVTFTNAAVAELEARIRLFIKLAFKVAKGEKIDNEVITEIVEAHNNTEEAKDRLNRSLRVLHETSIQTIHSFCQETLTEFAFETNQIYGAEIISDFSDIIDDIVKDYWRKKMAILPDTYGLKISNLKKILMNILSDKKYDSNGTEANKTRILKELLDYGEVKVTNELEESNAVTFDLLIKIVHRAVEEDRKSIIKKLQEKYDAVFVDEFQDTDKYQYEIFNTAFKNVSVLFYIGDPKQSIYAFRKADLNVYFQARENVDNVYTMNINFRSSKDYIDAMNVFFKPKPDFDTFFYGGESQTINYIDVGAINDESILTISNNKVYPITFMETKKKAVTYSDTANIACSILTKGLLNNEKIKPSSIGILTRTNGEANEVKSALQKKNIPSIVINDKKIFGSDEAPCLLTILETINDISWKGINNALFNDFTGLSSQDLLKLDDTTEVNKFKNLNSIWSDKGIYAMMLQFISDYNVKDNVLDPDNDLGEQVISNLYQLIEVLQRVEKEKRLTPKEVENFLRKKIEDPSDDVDEYIQRIESDKDSVTIMTIHKSKGLEFDIVIAPALDMLTRIPPFDYLDYRNKKGDYCFFHTKAKTKIQEESWKKQLEQENRRLLYVAITRARYNCFISKIIDNTYYNSSCLKSFYDALKDKENEQKEIIDFSEQFSCDENYVAEAKCEEKHFLDIPKIELPDKYWRKLSYSYLSADHKSYAKETKVERYEDEEYNQFIFKDLPKGALLGSMLHNIFEFVDFKDDQKWERVVAVSLRQFLPKYDGFFNSHLKQMIYEVINSDIDIDNESFKLSDIHLGQRRSEFEFDINVSRFELNNLQDRINELLPDNYYVMTKSNEQLEGILNGFIDLFFEYRGKYYILDWKSNFLGDTLDAYKGDKLVQAMNESNYHLQYLIYTLAIKKYLENKLPCFDYEKHFGGAIYVFLRGVRKNETSGLFTCKPPLKVIETIEGILIN